MRKVSSTVHNSCSRAGGERVELGVVRSTKSRRSRPRRPCRDRSRSAIADRFGNAESRCCRPAPCLLSRAGAPVPPGSRRDRRDPSPLPDGCGRRCSVSRTESPSWPRSRVLAALAHRERHEWRRIVEYQSRTSLSLRSRTPRIYRSFRAYRSGTVSALIMPRSASTHTRAMSKRRRSRSITGMMVLTSAVLPGHISEQRAPVAVDQAARIICRRSGRWSLL